MEKRKLMDSLFKRKAAKAGGGPAVKGEGVTRKKKTGAARVRSSKQG